MMRARVFAAIASMALPIAAAFGIQACASTPDPTRYTVIFTPDYNQFKGNAAAGTTGVSELLEKRCGTLDCHGQVGRPMRIYGPRGLRILDDAGNSPGSTSRATETEVLANFQSVVGLEPEQISKVIADPTNNPPTSLLFLKKPRLLERHKGGQVINQGDDADRCLTTWLLNQVDTAACASAVQVP